MKKYLALFMIALMFCAVISAGCGGGSDNDSSEPEQTESLNEDTGEYDPNEGGKGTSGTGEIDLSSLWSDYTAHDGEILRGKLEIPVKISVADGATITLRDVTIEGKNWGFYTFAGLDCLGDATINLEGTNSVKGYHWEYPGVYVPVDKTLTIKGTGSLEASSNGRAAGIGAGYELDCGNIIIEGGTITATGGQYAAGIGGGFWGNCGTITITDGTGTATKGDGAPYSIGAGYKGSCGTVTIYGVEGAISAEPGTYPKMTDLSTLTAAYTANNREILTGTLGAQVKISIADGATVILRDVHIEGNNWRITKWAGLTCAGDTTLILEGTNFVKSFHYDYPGIYVPEGKTLTIMGDGALTASGKVRSEGIGSAGIGAGSLSCGNIVIKSGTIDAIGGEHAAGIGGGHRNRCGNITITGGNVTATKGSSAEHSIGAGYDGTCGTVFIGGKLGPVSTSPFEHQDKMKITDLSTITADYTANNGEKLTGTLGANVKISIADGAGVFLRDVTINGVNNDNYSDNYSWAGINCDGDAVIYLEGTNSVKGFSRWYPCIHVPEGKTLRIMGDGALTTSSTGYGAGIGGGYYRPCGNIIIDGGTVTAKGGHGCAGIGGGLKARCGTITINGGKITATKGMWSPPYSVGPGQDGEGDKEITLCGIKYTADEDTFTYGFDPNTDGTFTVDIDTAAGYGVYSMAFYGRKCLGLNEDGSYKLSGWRRLKLWEANNVYNLFDHIGYQNFKLSRKYVELGFQFDIKARASYVYSEPFWPTKDRKNERIDSVFIDIGGVITNANITIKVNNATVVEKYNCYIDKNYDWDD